MPIQYDEGTRQFHLYNGSFSYIIKVLENNYIGQVYCGAPLQPDRAYPLLSPVPFQGFSNNDRNTIRFEYPSYGNGDYRLPAIAIVRADGSAVLESEYRGYRILKGKPEIPGLPSTYTEDAGEADTLEMELADPVSGIGILLYYTIFASHNCLARHARIVNPEGGGTVVIKNAMSLSLDLPDADWNLITLTGAWAREFQITDAPLRPGFQGVGSLLGISGHKQNPFLLLRRANTDDFSGEAIGISLLYSGNFLASAEVDHYGLTRVRAGINPETFSWELAPGNSFDTPEAVLTWTGAGLNSLSGDFHRLYRTRLARGFWRDRERPVLLNNWEGTYFNFTEEKLLDMAKIACDLGVDLFVLDDGWFGKRDSDNSSLGDWFPDTRKLPQGIAGLAEKITALGIKFGLWIEPEMISEKSRLFEAHPDWAIGVPGRKRTELRQQYVLDMSRKEIVDYLFALLKDLIASAPISYIKWDMNRSLTEPYSLALPPDRQGEFFHRYVLGVYDLYTRLTAAFPEVLFESCAGGGGRFDPGLLAFAPQGWLSDDTDALQRLSIQSAASLCYPLSSMGAHVSAVPNHQTGRLTSLAFRSMTAFFGVLGFELDPCKLSAEEQAAIVKYIAFYKTHRSLFQTGRFSRLVSPAGASHAAWMVRSAAGDKAIVGYYRLLGKPNPGPFRLPLKDLNPVATYKVSIWEEGGYAEQDKLRNCGLRGGDELMGAGLFLNSDMRAAVKTGDFFSELFLLTI
ncbi:alpha-galactosidase [Spirochaetia bacterium]|nr:alpha-galactosidase [Spirochaetia bacterium]